MLSMLETKEIEDLIKNYMDDLFIEPYKIILRPKIYSNAIYVILLGKIS